MQDELKQLFLDTSLDDYNSILNLANKIVNTCASGVISKKIAVIGTSSLQMIIITLKAMLLCEKIHAEFYEGEYNGIKKDIFDPFSPLYAFEPEIIIILQDIHEISNWPNFFDKKENVIKLAQEKAYEIIKSINLIHNRLPNSHIFCSNFAGPFENALGNLSGNVVFSKQSFISMINFELATKSPQYLTILNINKLACEIGFNNWYSPDEYFISKQGFSLKYIGYFCDLLKKLILASLGRIKKCLVLDLDNTLWGGLVGDVGYENILLDPNDPEGEAFLNFQSYVLDLKNRGVILAVCSKNYEETAKKPFEFNKFMKVKLDDISCFVANWEDKVTNIKNIAYMLNISTDSLVFFDDNPN